MMSNLKTKISIAYETFITLYKEIKRKVIWNKQRIGFQNFGDHSVFEEPLYTRNLQYASIGHHTIIKSGSRMQCGDTFAGIKLNPRLSIGNHCAIGYYFTAFVYDQIVIGDNVLIADNVLITSENHGMLPESDLSYASQPLEVAPVTIGAGVWLSKNVSILPGVTIGEKSIIGANGVVTNDIPPYSIAVGCPARVIKQWNFEKHCWEKLINGTWN